MIFGSFTIEHPFFLNTQFKSQPAANLGMLSLTGASSKTREVTHLVKLLHRTAELSQSRELTCLICTHVLTHSRVNLTS